MKALVTTRHGGPDVLAVQTFPERRPGPGEVRVDVARAGLNFADLAARNGLYPDAPKPPMVVGYEGAGTVGEVGPDVKGVRPGDRVAVVSRFGGQASQVVVPEGQVFAMPAGMSFDVGAALPVQYLTAYHVLHHRAQLRPGGRVLIHGAGGGLGLATLQLCRQIPDVVLFGTASKAKHEALRAAGLQHPIDYRTEDYEERVKALTQGRGVDLVFDPRGGNDWRKGYRLLAPAGHLICMGWSNMQRSGRRNLFRVLWEFLQMPRFSPIALMAENRTVSGVNLGTLWGEQSLLRPALEAILAQTAAGKLSPRIDRVFPLSEGAAAHRYLEEGRNVGKVLFDCTA